MEENESAFRIVDANFNRAREALRVVEDFTRFVLDSASLTERAKNLRHELFSVLNRLNLRGQLLFSRDTPGDVGVNLTHPLEREKESLRAVLRANISRLEEALRVLEETFKTFNPSAGAAIKKMRYQVYSLEKEIELRNLPKEALKDARLYAIIDPSIMKMEVPQAVEKIIRGGADILQLRYKGGNEREFLNIARLIRDLADGAGILFLVNDRPDIARLAGADGVHLGQQDIPPRQARKLLGPGKIVGLTAHSLDEARRAEAEGADYIGLGTIFPTKTKRGTSARGVGLIREVLPIVSVPVFAIGGITLKNLPEVIRAGATRVAVASGLVASGDPEQMTRLFREALYAEG